MKKMIRHTDFVKGHERKKCSLVSSESQKQHLLHPVTFCKQNFSIVESHEIEKKLQLSQIF
jgi:hypothetical protein